ncbi:Hypothetical predicted protein [Mytilus galloprovincialis]|uniref:Uncharacterized protein n=1 Tax=Mytilus galloprovincialis TaxID=29158 RepID=A0A8B6H2K2_MYTGA|nr:Hypothetical predicted protein [Mytilus galloprovincialis]
MTDCCIFDVVRGLALLVGLAAGSKSKISDLVFTTWIALGMFIFPDYVVGYQVSGKTDGLMIFFVRCTGASQLAMTMFMYLTRDTRDETVKGAILWSRTLGTAPMLMIMIYGQVYKNKVFGHGNLWFFLPFFISIWIYNVYQMHTPPPAVGRREQKGFVSILLRVYFLVFFVEGLQGLAFPNSVMFFMNTTPQFIHQHFVRVLCASDFSAIFLIWYAPSFLRDDDRKALFISHLAAAGLGILSLLAACFVDHAIEVSQMYWILLFMTPVLIPAIGLGLILQNERSKNAVFTTPSHYYTRSSQVKTE